MQATNIQYFRNKLMAWNQWDNNRTMPWKGEKDPYKIWLSEIILQQTRVEQGMAYYNTFITKYPNIIDLANANEELVFKDWEGLGYYNRCRNMLWTAKYISTKYNGVFPNQYDEILALKGIGPYTAAAITSFAFNKPYAVVDGNVVRVFSRFLGIDLPFTTNSNKTYYQNIAAKFLIEKNAATYNQAIMDFGATICKPRNPSCTSCPLLKKCIAFSTNAVDKYPPQKPKLTLKKRYFHYIIAGFKKKIYIKKRQPGDVWQDLFEPILIEQKEKPDILEQEEIIASVVQKLTHQEIYIYFYIINNSKKLAVNLDQYELINHKDLVNKAMPKSVFNFFKKFEYI